MKPLLAACILFAAASAVPAAAQDGATALRIALPPEPVIAALQAHDLRWITTANDFDQGSLAADAIDAEIERRIRAYDRETAIVTYEVPINSRRLSGPVGPRRYDAFDPRMGLRLDSLVRHGGSLDRTAYFWKYREFDIAVPGDGYRDQLNVYGVARALEVLRARYPLAYRRLFTGVQQFPADSPRIALFNNRFSTILFSFDESPKEIAASITALAANGFLRGGKVGYWDNLALVSVDATTIQGTTSLSGSLPIYRRSADENLARYLREGLVETLVHEMLHCYVDFYWTHDPVYSAIRAHRHQSDPEEAVVIATSLGYFLDEGGLQGDLPYFYRGKLEVLVTQIGGKVREFGALTQPGTPETNLPKDRLRLRLLDARGGAAP